MPCNLLAYIVRYDSGFAPNPFHRFCTLSTCKPRLRQNARVNDWVVGTASNSKAVKRGGCLVYAMRVTEILSISQYWHDPRFAQKKPDMFHNWVSASGDNIYEPIAQAQWNQLNSYHSHEDGSRRQDHVDRDTGVDRVLISGDFVYFGGEVPKLPPCFLCGGNFELVCSHRNYRRITDQTVVSAFEVWIRSLNRYGFQGKPWDWIRRRR